EVRARRARRRRASAAGRSSRLVLLVQVDDAADGAEVATAAVLGRDLERAGADARAELAEARRKHRVEELAHALWAQRPPGGVADADESRVDRAAVLRARHRGVDRQLELRRAGGAELGELRVLAAELVVDDDVALGRAVDAIDAAAHVETAEDQRRQLGARAKTER